MIDWTQVIRDGITAGTILGVVGIIILGVVWSERRPRP